MSLGNERYSVRNPLINSVCVTDEFSFTNGRKTNGGDVVFLINGISVFIELLHLKYPNHGKMFKALMRSCLK